MSRRGAGRAAATWKASATGGIGRHYEPYLSASVRQDLAQAIGEPAVVPRLITADPAAAEALLDRALEAGHEGIMAKSPDAPYAAGSRGAAWLKVKPVHTLDLVVLAVELA